jgi:hypothetical protein
LNNAESIRFTCWEIGVSVATGFNWMWKYVGKGSADKRRLRGLTRESSQLNRMYTDVRLLIDYLLGCSLTGETPMSVVVEEETKRSAARRGEALMLEISYRDEEHCSGQPAVRSVAFRRSSVGWRTASGARGTPSRFGLRVSASSTSASSRACSKPTAKPAERCAPVKNLASLSADDE